MFSFATRQWERKNPTGTVPAAVAGILTAYDVISGLIYLYDNANFYSYDVNADQYTKLSTAAFTVGYHLNAAIDPVRRKFIMAGNDVVQGGGRVWSIDLRPGSSYRPQVVNTTGGAGLVNSDYPGIEYDPVNDRLIGWTEATPDVVYALDLDANQWITTTISGAPLPMAPGPIGRWRYSPASNVFVVANEVGDNVSILRISAATLVRPVPPTAFKAQ